GFEGMFNIQFGKGINVIVGDNEVGKSTILEAINLALSGWLSGRYLMGELTQALFNQFVVKKYLESTEGTPLTPPEILIEIYMYIEDESLKALFEGNRNSTKTKACGFSFKIGFD